VSLGVLIKTSGRGRVHGGKNPRCKVLHRLCVASLVKSALLLDRVFVFTTSEPGAHMIYSSQRM